MQDWASKFYHSQAWLACRRSYIASRIQIDGACWNDDMYVWVVFGRVR